MERIRECVNRLHCFLKYPFVSYFEDRFEQNTSDTLMTSFLFEVRELEMSDNYDVISCAVTNEMELVKRMISNPFSQFGNGKMSPHLSLTFVNLWEAWNLSSVWIVLLCWLIGCKARQYKLRCLSDLRRTFFDRKL